MKVYSLLGSGLKVPHIIKLLVSFILRIWSKEYSRKVWSLQSSLLQSKHGSVKLGLMRTRFPERLLLLKISQLLCFGRTGNMPWKNLQNWSFFSHQRFKGMKQWTWKDFSLEGMVWGNLLREGCLSFISWHFFLHAQLQSHSFYWGRGPRYSTLNLWWSCTFTTSMDTGFPGL